MEVITLDTVKRVEFIDITSSLQKIVKKEKIKSGICVVFCPHTTAALTINENADPSVRIDILKHLDELVPVNKNYSHSEGNSDSHIKSSILSCSLSIIVEDEKLILGTWQGIYFCEFDGPRKRQVWVKLIKT